MPTLYTRTSNSITLQDALKNCASVLSDSSQGIALLYSPTCCQFAKVQPNGTLTEANEETLDLKNVFEARAFNKNCELRWLNELNGQGRATLLAEGLNISSYLKDSIPNLEALDTIPQDYLLWGKGVESSSSSGWGRLSAARIGSIHVPVDGLTADKRVYLKSLEYLEVGDYGNVAVVEERLMGLEVR